MSNGDVVRKYLAFINPLEDITGKDEVRCNVRFLTGDLKGKALQTVFTTGIYRYYYYGVTMEVVELDTNNQIIDVYDIRHKDFDLFKIDLTRAEAFNGVSNEVLSSNGLIYRTDQCIMSRDYPQVYQTICQNMRLSDNFVMYLYTMDHALLYFQIDFNIPKNNERYRNAIHRGFLPADKNKIKRLTDVKPEEVKSDEKLGQDAIDKLLKEIMDK